MDLVDLPPLVSVIVSVVILVLPIVLVALVVRWAVGGGIRDARDARQILDERYARGEIDRDEYEQKRQDLQN